MNKSKSIIWLLAGFLVVYHVVKVYTTWSQSDTLFSVMSDGHFQNSIRLWIIFSLLIVIMNKRIGIISMWLSIISLVSIQYILIPADVNFSAYFVPLKGFIFPTIISWFFWQQQKAENKEYNPN